ncbi:hypothetical protein BDA96_06G264100 [Sorghum bicolor]|uniref:At1g61320/AtMIF1 LRR domain-containing protein n=2 Tax=Sorghum bicolor TaxID=4558 RepID=A0A921QWE2_SORBI|nr:hypothetical protein BDA96_06G264100 [Sorghum bicolor]KXG27261.1 hypothetical protein SORBI_3006G241100 [Sorghum bicolor]
MPLRDSARSPCVSSNFLCSWRCRPKLTFTEETLGLKQNAYRKSDRTKKFTSRVDHILKNRSGVGVKSLKIAIDDHLNVDTCHFNSWLQNFITPGIEEVILFPPSTKNKPDYNFPCSLLFDGRGNSIRYLYLNDCAFRPLVGFNCLRSLTKLRLNHVLVTGEELECLISRSFGLEQLELCSCMEIICLKIPFWLDRLSSLTVSSCDKLQVIESRAPNLSTIELYIDPVQLLLGESSRVKNLDLEFIREVNCVSYAINKLPSIVPHLEILTLHSGRERVNTPMVANKFLHLKYLDISLADDDVDETAFGAYDYLSLVSFLDASPVLDTFILSVDQLSMHHDSVTGDDASYLRQIPEHKHDRLKKVQINGFRSAKSMVELTCHILENSSALENLTLDSIFSQLEDADDIVRCSGRKTGECFSKSREMIVEAHKALKVIERYILERVPSTVKLNIRRPCIRCHVTDV